MWAEILKQIGSGAVLLAAVAWLIRSLVVHLLSKDVETFKANLKAEAEKDLAQLKSNLELENTKLSIKLGALEGRRLEFIEDLYKKLAQFSSAADCFLVEPMFDDKKELYEEANNFIDSYIDFSDYLQKKVIYLPKPIEEKINKLHGEHMNAATTIVYNGEDDKEKTIKYLKDNMLNISKSTIEIREELAKEFRNLIGVES